MAQSQGVSNKAEGTTAASFGAALPADPVATASPPALGDSQHVRIPPAAHTYPSDVETVHRLMEDEFYDLETFQGRADFLAKACVYQCYFNLVRPGRLPAIWKLSRWRPPLPTLRPASSDFRPLRGQARDRS